MGKKPKRRVFRRPSPQQRTEDAARDRQRLDAAAQALLGAMPADQLAGELQAREWLLTEADRVAQLDPNPMNLSRYRYARSQYDVARAALALAARAS